MNTQIKNLLAQGKESQVKDSIVKSIRDFKKLGDSRGEVAETIESMYGREFLPFFNSQWNML